MKATNVLQRFWTLLRIIPPKMLSAILIGNNLVNITASSLATSLAYSFGGYMVSIATAALTVAILIFGEITPKNYATLNAEKITLRYIPILSFFMMIILHLFLLSIMVSRVFMKLLRVDPDAANKAMTEEELRTIVDVSHEDGVIESDEKKMIYNVFDLGDADAKILWFQESMYLLRMLILLMMTD